MTTPVTSVYAGAISIIWRKIRRRWRWLSGLLGLLLAWYALRGMAWDEVRDLVRGIDFFALPVIVFINLLMLPVMTARWWLLLRTLGTPVNELRLCGYRAGANAVSYLTPGPHFGGEPLSIYLLHRHHGISLTTASTSVVVDRLLELLASFTVLACSLSILALKGLPPFSGGEQLLGALVVLLAVSGIILALFTGRRVFSRFVFPMKRVYERYIDRLPRRLESVLDAVVHGELMAVSLCSQYRFGFLLANLLSIAHWLAIFAEFWLMSFFLGTSLSFWQLAAIVVVARLAFFTPVPAGIGVLEATLPWVTASLGLGTVLGLGLCLIVRLRDLFFSLAGLGLTMKYLTCPGKVTIIEDITVRPGGNDPVLQSTSVDLSRRPFEWGTIDN